MTQPMKRSQLGGRRDPAGGWCGYGLLPKAVKNFLAYSLDSEK